MTYNHNFVACIKVNGNVLREFKDEVYLPFGSEYTIFLKNLDTRRAVVSIQIDGKHLGRDLVIDGNSEVEIERFIGDDLNKGYRFKFIEKTEQISEYHGDFPEDGIVRISYRYEKRVPVVQNISCIRNTKYFEPSPYEITFDNNFENNCCLYSCEIKQRSVDNPRNIEVNCCSNDKGITVEGSDSDQSFYSVSVGSLETEEYVICFRLKGGTKEQPKKESITVNKKVKCKYCGKRSTSNNKFCPNCSARLI